jgi:predicted XRE-type DNA-binding protein
MRAGARATVESKRRGAAPRIERSSGNVFEDLGLPDAAALLAKSELVSRICDIIVKRGLTQAQAAEILGVNQPKVSALMRGHLDGFSSDRLFRFLNALGSDIEIAVKPRARSSTRPSIRVVKHRLAG